MEANNESTYHLPVKSPGIASNEMAGESGIIEVSITPVQLISTKRKMT